MHLDIDQVSLFDCVIMESFKMVQTHIVFCVILFSISSVRCDCKIVINEINVIDPKKPGNREFIELKSTCDSDIPLRGYKLICFNCQQTTGSIDMVVTLWNYRVKEGFFTIGGPEVHTVDLKLPHDCIKFKSSFDSKSKKTQQTL